MLDQSQTHPIPITLEELTAPGASLSRQIFFVLTRFLRGHALLMLSVVGHGLRCCKVFRGRNEKRYLQQCTRPCDHRTTRRTCTASRRRSLGLLFARWELLVGNVLNNAVKRHILLRAPSRNPHPAVNYEAQQTTARGWPERGTSKGMAPRPNGAHLSQDSWYAPARQGQGAKGKDETRTRETWARASRQKCALTSGTAAALTGCQ